MTEIPNLLKKCSRIHSMLDKVAEYKGAFERIKGGGELSLASRCLKNIADGNDHLLLNKIRGQDKGHLRAEDSRDSQSQPKNKLILPGKSSCQCIEQIRRMDRLSVGCDVKSKDVRASNRATSGFFEILS